VLNEPGVQQPSHESVLIRAHSPGHAFGTDPRCARREGTSSPRSGKRPGAAADIRSPFTTSGLTSGDAALVTFSLAGNPDNDDRPWCRR